MKLTTASSVGAPTEDTTPRHRRVMAPTLIAASGSAVFAVLAGPILTTTTYAWLLTALLAAACVIPVVIDLRERRLPNRWTAPIAAAAAVQAVVVAIATHDPHRGIWAILAAAGVFAGYLALASATWFGFGDVKFAAAVTLTVGIYAGLFAIYLVAIAVILGGVYRMILTAAGHGSRPRAHGPAIAIAAIAIMTTAILIGS